MKKMKSILVLILILNIGCSSNNLLYQLEISKTEKINYKLNIEKKKFTYYHYSLIEDFKTKGDIYYSNGQWYFKFKPFVEKEKLSPFGQGKHKITKISIEEKNTCKISIKDQQDNKPVFFATVGLRNRKNEIVYGVESDFDGNCELLIQEFPAEIQISYLGYLDYSFKLTQKGSYEVDVLLSEPSTAILYAMSNSGLCSREGIGPSLKFDLKKDKNILIVYNNDKKEQYNLIKKH